MKKYNYFILVCSALLYLCACSSNSTDDEPEIPFEEEEEEYQEVPSGNGWNDEDGFSRYFKYGDWYTFQFEKPGEEGICNLSTYSIPLANKNEASQKVTALISEGKKNVRQDGRIVTYDAPEFLKLTYHDVRSSFGNVQEKYLGGYWSLYKIFEIRKNNQEGFEVKETIYPKDNPAFGEGWVINPEDQTIICYKTNSMAEGYPWQKVLYGNYKFTVYNWGGQGVFQYEYINLLIEDKTKIKGSNINFTELNEDSFTIYSQYNIDEYTFKKTYNFKRESENIWE